MIMNIALAADEFFAIPCLITIVSILENNKGNECRIYVLTTGFSQKTLDKFSKINNIYHQKIEVITMKTEQLQGVKIDPVFSAMTYFRFFLPNILVAEEKVLYLDCDMLICKALDDLYNTDLSGKACAVVEDQWADDIRAKNRLNIESPTFNAGMLVMNLEYWRQNNISRKCIDYLINNKETCIFCDQDAMNALLENQVIYLPYRYNMQAGWFGNLNEIPFHRNKWDILKQEMSKTVIMHYSMRVKPWHKESTHPFKNDYVRYAKIHPFIGFSEKYHNSIKLRIFQKLLNIYNKMTKQNITLS